LRPRSVIWGGSSKSVWGKDEGVNKEAVGSVCPCGARRGRKKKTRETFWEKTKKSLKNVLSGQNSAEGGEKGSKSRR